MAWHFLFRCFLQLVAFPMILVVGENMFIDFLAPVYIEDAFNKFVQLRKQYEDIVCRTGVRNPGC